MKIAKSLFLTIIVVLIIPNISFPIVQESQQAIDFNLPDIYDNGKTYSLKDFKGKVILLNIWASWCTGCQAEMPELLNLQDEYKAKGLSIVAVSVDSSKDKAVEFLKKLEEKNKMKINFIVPYDKEKAITKDYKPRGMPASYLIDKNGKLAKIFLGSFTSSNMSVLKSAIEETIR